MAFAYLAIGIFIGWKTHEYRSRGNSAISRHMQSPEERGPTRAEIIEGFSQAPFEIKTFLAAAMKHRAVYREEHDYAWDCYSECLVQFVSFTTIRNGICRCVVRDDAKIVFCEIPELLSDVRDEDIERHAVKGEEGVRPQVFSPSGLLWWYYTDDVNAPAPVGAFGFMRQTPLS